MRLKTGTVIVALFGVVLLLPGASLVYIPVGFGSVRVSTICYLSMLLICIIDVVRRGLEVRGYQSLVLASIVFCVYFAGAMYSGDVVGLLVVRHFEFFLPFIVACAVLAAPSASVPSVVTRKVFSVSLCVGCLLISSAYIFAEDVLFESIAGVSEGLAAMAASGRMPWDGIGAAFVMVFWNMNDSRSVSRLWIISILIVGVLLVQNRTMLLAVGVVLLYFALMRGRQRDLPVFGLAIAAAVGIYAALPEVQRDMFDQRILNIGDSGDLGVAIEDNRLPLYAQYALSIMDNYVFGQGLGVPLAMSPDNGDFVYTADISIISFLLPFGLAGLFLIFVFWWSCFRLIFELSPRHRSAYFVLLVVAIFASLNVDLFSRNAFVVALALMLRSAPHRVDE